eukprot:CAMPEP_0119381886 /NCGR_PEP_ID=MMETSP1334-20130426/68058_1 /TAXON_ID=127549 /ORGANISM="Calcidiscus leptoporus, Strain RCC1130" /LENGTH=39 /DNA_ID= /DNA_START= /DNA_END= /DNA_ORIENTATION=
MWIDARQPVSHGCPRSPRFMVAPQLAEKRERHRTPASPP